MFGIALMCLAFTGFFYEVNPKSKHFLIELEDEAENGRTTRADMAQTGGPSNNKSCQLLIHNVWQKICDLNTHLHLFQLSSHVFRPVRYNFLSLYGGLHAYIELYTFLHTYVGLG